MADPPQETKGHLPERRSPGPERTLLNQLRHLHHTRGQHRSETDATAVLVLSNLGVRNSTPMGVHLTPRRRARKTVAAVIDPCVLGVDQIQWQTPDEAAPGPAEAREHHSHC